MPTRRHRLPQLLPSDLPRRGRRRRPGRTRRRRPPHPPAPPQRSAVPPQQPPRPAPPPVPPRPAAPPRRAAAPAVAPPREPWADAASAPVATPAAELPDRGWRRLLRLATFGLVKLGPSAAQRQEAQFEAAIRTVLRGNHKVGVLGKGGVGKTSVAASVGSLFAELRRAGPRRGDRRRYRVRPVEQPNRPAVELARSGN